MAVQKRTAAGSGCDRADERTILTERLAARIGIDRHSSSSPGISLAVVLRDLSRTYHADAVEWR